MSRAARISEDDVLAILHRQTRPMSAYDVMAELRPIHPKVAPTTIYRLLSALSEKGHVHRVESLNAFVACSHASHAQSAIMSICDACGSVEETLSSALVKNLAGITGKSGFAPSRHVIEVHGVCATCNEESHSG